MLNLRPYRKNDSQKIVTWVQDENTFYKWSEGRLGNFPVSAERLEQAVSGRIDNEKYFRHHQNFCVKTNPTKSQRLEKQAYLEISS